jgi:2-keto-4-pentenoate hydratase/2-oxohepta-3-ene-1,7-dioic acid hydratase in catechol pathway
VRPGDEVATEVEGIGRLLHTMADDQAFGRG